MVRPARASSQLVHQLECLVLGRSCHRKTHPQGMGNQAHGGVVLWEQAWCMHGFRLVRFASVVCWSLCCWFIGSSSLLICPSVHPFVGSFMRLFVCHSVCLSVLLSVCLSVCSFVRLFVCSFGCLFVGLGRSILMVGCCCVVVQLSFILVVVSLFVFFFVVIWLFLLEHLVAQVDSSADTAKCPIGAFLRVISCLA